VLGEDQDVVGDILHLAADQVHAFDGVGDGLLAGAGDLDRGLGILGHVLGALGRLGDGGPHFVDGSGGLGDDGVLLGGGVDLARGRVQDFLR